ncbi:hypothetical protein DAERI_060087 [Deinococcus aerius]|uniref:Uncharacterized protein n=1 Tax=Deinococcus aerius TaxID=200253 RepID=A0A2I9DTA0_9DEIO|nr:hypothetical protein [Deinococcus aerius]GBF05827.1 hypothetical protein DAERI_060087 [Deinococcus aerius]
MSDRVVRVFQPVRVVRSPGGTPAVVRVVPSIARVVRASSLVLRASSERLPARGGYPASSFAERVDALQDRKAEGADVVALAERVGDTEARLSGLEGAPDLYLQPTRPAVPAGTTYLWVQTGLGPDGTGYSLWFEDGEVGHGTA